MCCKTLCWVCCKANVAAVPLEFSAAGESIAQWKSPALHGEGARFNVQQQDIERGQREIPAWNPGEMLPVNVDKTGLEGLGV